MNKIVCLLLLYAVNVQAQAFKPCLKFNCSQIFECEIDWSQLQNIPADLADGDDVNDADSDPTNELQTLSFTTQTICVDWAEAIISDNPNPSIDYNKNVTNISVTGGSGNNGVGRIYTLTFPPHPQGTNYTAQFTVFDDTQADTGLPEVISQTATSITYQLPQGDDGGSEDDNDYYRHMVRISSQPITVITSVQLN